MKIRKKESVNIKMANARIFGFPIYLKLWVVTYWKLLCAVNKSLRWAGHRQVSAPIRSNILKCQFWNSSVAKRTFFRWLAKGDWENKTWGARDTLWTSLGHCGIVDWMTHFLKVEWFLPLLQNCFFLCHFSTITLIFLTHFSTSLTFNTLPNFFCWTPMDRAVS